MANICKKCGNELKEGAAFCEVCGSAVETSGNAAPENAGLVGFSARVHDPEISAAIKKNRSAARVFSFIIVPLPLLGFIIYSLISDEMETSKGLLYGAIVSGIFLLFALFGLIKGRESNSYEATVIDKRHRTRHTEKNGFEEEFITVVRTVDGKRKKIRERGGRTFAYSYLEVGDRFRYHPQFAFPYELYDKSKAKGIYCVACQTNNPVSRDRCEHCGIPLLK